VTCECDAAVCQTGNCENVPVCGSNQLIALTPGSPSYSVASISMTDPSQPNHVWTTKYDFDVSAFTAGGTVTFSGVVSAATSGNPNACGCSFNLFSECEEYPMTGMSFGIANASDVTPGSSWSMPYAFPPGTPVLHFGAEGDWDSTPGSTNTSSLTVVASP
jgi:hypothetical protein